MSFCDLHTHSLLDDGHATLEEMVLSALGKGLPAIGLSGHSPLPFANDWAMSETGLHVFRVEAKRLGEEYDGRIRVYCGLEYDVLSETELADFDYVIGSVHHLSINGKTPSVDESPAATEGYLRDGFQGDAKAAEESFYAQYDRLAANPAVDIVGHFDLITKFDEAHETFRALPDCAVPAMDALIKAGKLFEVNTGAISRGYRKTPYPSRELLTLLKERGGRVILSSDAHAAKDIAFGFGEAAALLKSCGFSEVWQLGDAAFFPAPLL